MIMYLISQLRIIKDVKKNVMGMDLKCEEKQVDQEKKPVVSQNVDERYHTLFEQVNAAAFLTSFEGQILEANQKSCDLLGYSWEEMLRLSLRDILPKETDWAQFIDEICARGGLHIETESVKKDGGYISVEIRISLFRMNKKPVMFVLIWDITDRRKQEKRLRESEKKYHGLFEYTTDGIFVLDARGDILDVNTKLCEMLDVNKDNFVARNLFSMDLLTAKSLPVVIAQFEQLLSEKSAKRYTTEMQTKQGKILDVEISSFFLVRKDNELDNFVLILRDVTSRTEYEVRRQKEHELLKTLMDNVPDSVYFKDEQNRFILVNKAKAVHCNKKSDEMIGKNDFDFMPEEQAKKSFEDDTRIMLSGQSLINNVEKIVYKDGSEKWTSVTKIPRYNSEGEIIGTMGISRDITIQEKAREELKRSEERYRAVFENSSFAIILTDESGKIISWNKLVEELLSMGRYELERRPVESLYPADEWEKIHAEYVHDEGIKRRIETKVIRKDRRVVDVDLSINVLKSIEGKILGSTEIISDITKRKKAEEESKRQHELLQGLMDSIPDSIYFKDDKNQFILVNKAKANRWNVQPSEMLGKNDFDFLPVEQAQHAFDDDNMVLRTGKAIVDKIEKITGSDGVERWFSVTKVPRYDPEGHIIGTIGISRDVTEWKKTMKE